MFTSQQNQSSMNSNFFFFFTFFLFLFFLNLQIHPAGQVEPYSSQLWRAGPYMVGWGYVANQVSILPYFPLISLSNITFWQ